MPQVTALKGRVMPEELSPSDRQALLSLAIKGPGGDFDPDSMRRLFNLGLIEVRSDDRRVALTKEGLKVCRQLLGEEST